MKWSRKLLIGLCSLILLAALLDVGLHFWVNLQLPKIINRKDDAAYFIKYKKLNVSLFKSHISAHEVVIVPKAALKDSVNKAGIYAKVHSVDIKNFKILNLLFNDKLRAQSITVNQPKVVLYQKNKRERIREAVVAPFEKIITVSEVYVSRGDFKIIDIKTKDAVLGVSNINLNLDGIVVTEKTLGSKIPFQFKNYNLNCDSLYFHPNDFYHIKTRQIKTSKSHFKIAKFEMLPKYSRREFVAKIPKEKDLYTLLCDTIEIDKMNWGFKADDFFFHCNSIHLDKASANIFRSKVPVDDKSKRPLYNKLLRDMKFDLKVDTLKVRNSFLEYEEEKSSQAGPAKLAFSSFNITATSINSGFKKTKLPDLKIKINCLLMKSSPLYINWRLNPMDKNDGFTINGTLSNFDAERITPFSEPYLNLKPKGIIDEVKFNFVGNDDKNTGKFKMEYDDLKLTFYKKDNPKKKKKLLNFLAKIFVKKDSKEKLKETTVDVKRTPDRSFYNLIWKSIEEGLKKILV